MRHGILLSVVFCSTIVLVLSIALFSGSASAALGLRFPDGSYVIVANYEDIAEGVGTEFGSAADFMREFVERLVAETAGRKEISYDQYGNIMGVGNIGGAGCDNGGPWTYAYNYPPPPPLPPSPPPPPPSGPAPSDATLETTSAQPPPPGVPTPSSGALPRPLPPPPPPPPPPSQGESPPASIEFVLFTGTGPNGSFNATGHLQVQPSLIRSGETVRVYWNATNVSSCSVTGTNGDSWPNTSFSGAGGKTTAAIVEQTTYTLQCTAISGATPPSITESQMVDVIPIFEEQ